MSRFVVQGNIIQNRQIVEDQMLICEKGKLVYVGPNQEETPDLVIKNGYLAPGYIDIHVHGSHGFDVMDGTEESIQAISQSLVRYGVTSYLATTLTGKLDDLIQVLKICKKHSAKPSEGAQIAGVHLEGPWIDPAHKGAQNESYIIPPSLSDAKRLVDAADGLIKVVTLSPESPESKQVIHYLRENGITVSIGHSDAKYETVKEALDYGLSHVTHCFNAMRGLHHREPGVAGAAMYHDELTAELIADGIHVHPVVMSILYKIKTVDRMVLVSDGMRAVGMNDGEYELGGLKVRMTQGEARLADGTLAGSTLTLDLAVRNMVQLCGVPIPQAIAMATEIPAQVIGVGNLKGKLEAGYDADFVILDEALHILKVFVGGKEAYSQS